MRMFSSIVFIQSGLTHNLRDERILPFMVPKPSTAPTGKKRNTDNGTGQQNSKDRPSSSSSKEVSIRARLPVDSILTLLVHPVYY